MNLFAYGKIVRTNALVLLILLVVAVAGGLLFSLVQTPKYRSTAIAYVVTQQATNLNDLAQGVDFGKQVVRSYATIIPTPLILSPVIRDLNLKTDPFTLGKEVEVEVPLDTVVLNITVTDPSPINSARIANAIASSLSATVPTLTPATADSVEPVRLTIAQRAVPPTSPVVPNTLLNVGVALVAAVALAVFIAVVRDALLKRAAELRRSGPSVDEQD